MKNKTDSLKCYFWFPATVIMFIVGVWVGDHLDSLETWTQSPQTSAMDVQFLSSKTGHAVATPAVWPTIYRVTAYCPNECCCGKYADGTTASGHKAEGKIVAAPKTIPFGTKVSIPGYGQGIVRDRGGAITEGRLDVLFPTHQEALDWGVKYLEVKLWPER